MTVDTAFLFEERNVVQFLLCERANKYFGSILLEEIVLGSFFFHRLGQVFALLLIHTHLTARLVDRSNDKNIATTHMVHEIELISVFCY